MSADTNYVTPEPAANVISLPCPLPPTTTPSSQLENVVDTPRYSEVLVNIKKVLNICVMRGHTHYSTYFRPIVTKKRKAQHKILK